MRSKCAACPFPLALALSLGLLTAAAQARPPRGNRQRPAPSTSRATTSRSAGGGLQGRRGSGATKGGQGDLSARREAVQEKVPAPSPAEQQNLSQLRTDLGTIGQGMKGSQEEIRKLATDLQGMGLQKPDSALVHSLAGSLQAAFADGSLSPAETAELTQDVYALLNSAGLSKSDIEVLTEDVQSILEASGVGQAEIQAVVSDLEAIQSDSNLPVRRGLRGRGR